MEAEILTLLELLAEDSLKNLADGCFGGKNERKYVFVWNGRTERKARRGVVDSGNTRVTKNTYVIHSKIFELSEG